MQGLIGAAVHQLQHLHGELHVAQAAPSQLDLAIAQLRLDVFLDARAHLLAIRHEVRARGGGPHERGHRIQVRLAERRVTRDGTSLEQCLELPVVGPFLVIRLVRLHGAHQLAGLAFGAERAVNLPQCGFRDAGDDVLAHALHRSGDARAHAVERVTRQRRNGSIRSSSASSTARGCYAG